MTLIDVTELMIDPEFVGPMQIIHRQSFINQMGENQLIEKTVVTIGSIQPASGKTLQRLPEALRLADVSEFFVKGQIVADGTCAYPDLLVFNSQRYAVQTIDDFMNWPANVGYCRGTAVRERPSL